jgi:hypothetical protein
VLRRETRKSCQRMTCLFLDGDLYRLLGCIVGVYRIIIMSEIKSGNSEIISSHLVHIVRSCKHTRPKHITS